MSETQGPPLQRSITPPRSTSLSPCTTMSTPRRFSTPSSSRSSLYSDRFIPSRLSSNLEDAFNNIDKNESFQHNNNGLDIAHENQGILNHLIRSELLGIRSKGSISYMDGDYDNNSLSSHTTRSSHQNVLKYSTPRRRTTGSTSSSTTHSRDSFQPHISPTLPHHSNTHISPKKSYRKIPKMPYKILDAPNLADDYYLNLVDWSASNILAVALGSSVFTWSACTSKVTKLLELDSQEVVTSITWAVRGSQLAVGTFSGQIQIWDATTCTKIRDMIGHTSRVGTLAWSSSMLASGSRDRSILTQDVRIRSNQSTTTTPHGTNDRGSSRRSSRGSTTHTTPYYTPRLSSSSSYISSRPSISHHSSFTSARRLFEDTKESTHDDDDGDTTLNTSFIESTIDRLSRQYHPNDTQDGRRCADDEDDEEEDEEEEEDVDVLGDDDSINLPTYNYPDDNHDHDDHCEDEIKDDDQEEEEDIIIVDEYIEESDQTSTTINDSMYIQSSQLTDDMMNTGINDDDDNTHSIPHHHDDDDDDNDHSDHMLPVSDDSIDLFNDTANHDLFFDATTHSPTHHSLSSFNRANTSTLTPTRAQSEPTMTQSITPSYTTPSASLFRPSPRSSHTPDRTTRSRPAVPTQSPSQSLLTPPHHTYHTPSTHIPQSVTSPSSSSSNGNTAAGRRNRASYGDVLSSSRRERNQITGRHSIDNPMTLSRMASDANISTTTNHHHHHSTTHSTSHHYHTPTAVLPSYRHSYNGIYSPPSSTTTIAANNAAAMSPSSSSSSRLFPVSSSLSWLTALYGPSTATSSGFGAGKPCIIQELVGHKQEVCGLKWSFDEKMLASGGNDNKLYVWQPQLPTNTPYSSHSHIDMSGSNSSSSNGVSNSRIAEPICKFNDHTAAVKAVAWSPHQHGLLASGGGTADRHIRFWNANTNTALHRIDTGSQVCNLVWSTTVNELVSTHGYSLNQIIVWKYPSMQKLATLTGHTTRVLYLAMSPDGQSIITGAGDETLRFWNIFPSPRHHHYPTTAISGGGGLIYPTSSNYGLGGLSAGVATSYHSTALFPSNNDIR